ncbi:serine/threonine-protein phosphatase 2b catalytic subunit 1-related [Anaeramoeba flamelloides]|uniref:Serine/threonine-protein phosphatase 2b catalytic subunit 1-related n=1 Tax=Anaeramoeba flamelloides TaxID=1746091 RepID=A0ABQ8YH33_9EUKA|nr:serine/threonine-protein phosphatase 2b catalytic subunit 1-related [Anaeramoeba flamelloides]
MDETLNLFSASQESVENSSSSLEIESMDLDNKGIYRYTSSSDELFDLEVFLSSNNNRNSENNEEANENSPQTNSFWGNEMDGEEIFEQIEQETKIKEDDKAIFIINCGEDRQVSEVPPPTRVLLTYEELFSEFDNCPDSFLLREHLRQEGKIEKKAILEICYQAQTIFRKEDNLLHVRSPIIIVGDLHGQFYDLLNILAACGECEEGMKNYLFLGDYVDRGNFGIEIVLYLFTLKISQPNGCFLLRVAVNHECRQLTSFFNFKKEVIEKYDEEIYDVIMETFDCLPITAIVDDQFFCVHGGISPKLISLESINEIDRFKEPPTKGLLSELLWSDPHSEYDSPKSTQYSFTPNDLRGCGYNYSYYAVCKFLSSNNLTCVIRAHEAQQDGYLMYKKNEETNFPSLITIFSSPNYAGLDQNKGAVIQYQNRSVTIKEFKGVDHPYWLPNYNDIFRWSIPFIDTKISSFWTSLISLKQSSNSSFLDNKINFEKSELFEKGELIFENVNGSFNSGLIQENNKMGKGVEKERRIGKIKFLNKLHSTILMNKIKFFIILFNDFNKIRKNHFIGQYLKKNRLSNIGRSQSIGPSFFLTINNKNNNRSSSSSSGSGSSRSGSNRSILSSCKITCQNNTSIIGKDCKNNKYHKQKFQKVGLFKSASLEGHLLKYKLAMGFKKMWLAAEKENRKLQLKASKLLMGEKNSIFDKIENLEYEQSSRYNNNKIIEKNSKLSRSDSVKENIQIENIDQLIQQDELNRSQLKKRKLMTKMFQNKSKNKIRRTNKKTKKLNDKNIRKWKFKF